MTEQEDRKNKRVAFLTTIGFYSVMALLLIFVVAFKAPDPPLPEYGVELNFGLDDEGFGDVQPETPVGNESNTPEEPGNPEPEQAKAEETAKPQEEIKTSEVKEDAEKVTTEESEAVPIKEKEKKEEPKPEKPKEKQETKPVEVKPKVDPNATYKPNTAATTNKETAGGKEGKPGNHGDDPGKTGDKGNPQGSLDAKALYGKPGGGGGGTSLELSGWEWDARPDPKIPNSESGRVVFEIKVDDSGDIVSIKTLERSISLEAEQICRKEIEKLTFNKIGSNVPPISTGKVTFVVRSK